MELDDIITLADAAEELGVGASTLRHQAQSGRLEAKVFGKTWITTRQEVERYREAVKGQVGRPPQIIRRASQASGWSTIFTVSQDLATRRGRMLDIRGIVAHVTDGATSGAEIIVGLNIEGPANGLIFDVTRLDPIGEVVYVRVRDLRAGAALLGDGDRTRIRQEIQADPRARPLTDDALGHASLTELSPDSGRQNGRQNGS